MTCNIEKDAFVTVIHGPSKSGEKLEECSHAGMKIIKQFDSGAAIVILTSPGASLSIGKIQRNDAE